MLEKLFIKKTRETPEIDFLPEEGLLRIEGRSLPENTNAFYNPAIDWLAKYIQSPKQKTKLDIFMEYLNSGSLKQLFRIMYQMEDLMELGYEVEICWKYKKNDTLMLQKGREFKNFMQVPIELKAI